MNALTNGATIIVESTGETYHTLESWGMAIGNNNCIGEPVMEEHYVNIPGLDKTLDMNEALTGRQNYTHRSISIKLGGIRQRYNWDSVISDIRNKIHGQIVKMIFDNDKAFYWTGRAQIAEFDRKRELGTFEINIPHADPYKYELLDSTQNWIWDTFNFFTGIISKTPNVLVNGAATYTLSAENMPIVPTFLVSAIGTEGMTVQAKGETYQLKMGKNRIPELTAYKERITYTFTGRGTVTIQYRRGAL